MGQYHVIVNITKNERIHPHKLGHGLKQWENIGGAEYSPSNLLYYLLCHPSKRGGGDFPEAEYKGRWYGDQIAVIGDYSEKDDHPLFDATLFYGEMDDGHPGPIDITDRVLPEWLALTGYKVVDSSGWRRIERQE